MIVDHIQLQQLLHVFSMISCTLLLPHEDIVSSKNLNPFKNVLHSIRIPYYMPLSKGYTWILEELKMELKCD